MRMITMIMAKFQTPANRCVLSIKKTTRQIILPPVAFPLHLILVAVFQVILISSHYNVVSGAFCDLARSLSYEAQPTACQNIPQCGLNCQYEDNSTAMSICTSSVTYCNPDGSVCGYYVTGGNYTQTTFFRFTIIQEIKSSTIYFTKGFNRVAVRLVNLYSSGFDFSSESVDLYINNTACNVRKLTDSSCSNQIYVNCTNLNQGWYNGCTGQSSEGSVLKYFFSLDKIRPCNNVPAPTSPASPTMPAPKQPIIIKQPTVPAPPSPTIPAPKQPIIIIKQPTVPAPTSPTMPAPKQPIIIKQPTVPAPPSPTMPAPQTSPTMTAPQTSPTLPVPATCFSSYNTVYVKDVGPIPMNELQIGDMVQSDHFDTYTQVYGFGHHDHDSEETDYIQFLMNHNDIVENEEMNSLEISSLHLIYIQSRENYETKNKNEKEKIHINDMITIRASGVIVGDKIWNGRQYQTIQSIQHVKRHGLYAPLTQSGHLIVSNVMVSNYVHLLNDHVNLYLLWDQHDLGHIFFFPHRYYCQHNINDCQKETYSNGYSYWAYYIVHIGSHMNQYRWFGALLVSLLAIPMFIIATIIEISLILFGLFLLYTMVFMIARMKVKKNILV